MIIRSTPKPRVVDDATSAVEYSQELVGSVDLGVVNSSQQAKCSPTSILSRI